MITLMQEATKFISKLTIKQGIILFFAIVIISTFVEEIIKKIKKNKEERKYRDKDAAFEEKVIREFEKEFNMKPLHNLVLPWQNGKTVADLAFVSNKGIFCIECKHWGEERDCVRPNWDQTIWRLENRSGKRDKIYFSPLRQNSIHTGAIRNVLNSYVPTLAQNTTIFNIVFVQNIIHYLESGVIDTGDTVYFSRLHGIGACIVSTNSSNLKKMSCTKGIDQFKKEHDQLATVLTTDQVLQIGEILKNYVNNSPVLQKHIEDIKRSEED